MNKDVVSGIINNLKESNYPLMIQYTVNTIVSWWNCRYLNGTKETDGAEDTVWTSLSVLVAVDFGDVIG